MRSGSPARLNTPTEGEERRRRTEEEGTLPLTCWNKSFNTFSSWKRAPGPALTDLWRRAVRRRRLQIQPRILSSRKSWCFCFTVSGRKRPGERQNRKHRRDDRDLIGDICPLQSKTNSSPSRLGHPAWPAGGTVAAGNRSRARSILIRPRRCYRPLPNNQSAEVRRSRLRKTDGCVKVLHNLISPSFVIPAPLLPLASVSLAKSRRVL